MNLELTIRGTVDKKYKNEHEVIDKISKMFLDINKLEFSKRQDMMI